MILFFIQEITGRSYNEDTIGKIPESLKELRLAPEYIFRRIEVAL
ncbi:MAG: hypothetical protein ACYSTS_18140 [Planctomycetota bacterium]